MIFEWQDGDKVEVTYIVKKGNSRAGVIVPESIPERKAKNRARICEICQNWYDRVLAESGN